MRHSGRTPDEKSGKRDGDQPPGKGCGDGLIALPGFRAPISGPSSGCAELETASRCDDVLSAARPAHPKPNRSGYAIPEHSVDAGELRPWLVIAHPKVGGPTPASTTILTDRRSCSAPRNRQHTSTLPGGARHEEYRTGPESVDKFAKGNVADVVNAKRLTSNLKVG